MFGVNSYLNELVTLLYRCFGSRLLYVGLQGSYLREEATESSDIDIMVVIDELTVEDLDRYRAIILSLENPEKSCGFICGKSDLSNWNPMEICHLLNSTRDYYGALKELVPTYTQLDVRNFAKMSVNNLYHEICHRYIHSSREKNVSKLPSTYKGVFFILQNIYYLRTGEFIPTKEKLLQLISENDKAVLKCSVQLSKNNKYDFDECFELLFKWCQYTLKSLENNPMCV